MVQYLFSGLSDEVSMMVEESWEDQFFKRLLIRGVKGTEDDLAHPFSCSPCCVKNREEDQTGRE